MALRTLLVSLLLAAVSLTTWATDYFVSSSIGDDRFSGRAASPGTGASGPLLSLKALEAITLQHGDRILLRCGEKFAGPLRLTLNSQAPGDLTLMGYGDCTPHTRPTIDGRVPMLLVANGSLQQSTESEAIVQVFSGDQALPMARYPANSYSILPATALSSTGSLPADAALTGRSLLGARLHARTQEWIVEERTIVSPEGRFDAALQYPLRPKTGYYLSGKSWMLGERQGWSMDTSDKKLTLRAMPNKPLSKVLSGHLLQVAGKGSISIVGIDFDAAGGDAIHSRIDGIISIKEVGIRRSSGNGIAIWGGRSAYVIASTIQDVGLDAIFFAETKRVFVRRNQISNAGLYGGPRPSLAAINAHRTDSATIEENVVENSAYHGIRFAGDARIRRNYVSQSCLLLSDCAAIYTWRRNPTDRRPAAEVIGNVIVGAQGDTTVKLGVNDWFAGIYLDEFSNNILVDSNVVVGVNQGIYLHNAYDNQVRNNVIRALKKTLIDAADSTKFPATISLGNSVHSNSERLGPYSAAILEASGKPGMFSFDVRVSLGLAPQGASTTEEARKCNADETLATDRLAKQEVAVTAVLNCD